MITKRTFKAIAKAAWVMFTAVNSANIATIPGWPRWYFWGGAAEVSLSLFVLLVLFFRD